MSKRGQGWGIDGDLHAKFNDDNVTVGIIGAAEDVVRPVKQVEGGCE